MSGTPKKRRKKGSSRNGIVDPNLGLGIHVDHGGVTFSSMGASEGICCPATSGGTAARQPAAKPKASPSRAIPVQKTLDFKLMNVAPWPRCEKTPAGGNKVSRSRVQTVDFRA
jgi:hypothetical protein